MICKFTNYKGNRLTQLMNCIVWFFLEICTYACRFNDLRRGSKTAEKERICLFVLSGIDDITEQEIYKCPLSVS